MYNSKMSRTHSWPPPFKSEYDHSKEGMDHVKKAVIAFMDAGEYQNAIDILYTLEGIDERKNEPSDEPSNRLKGAAEKYMEMRSK